jgi:Uma2 family endonuclease
MMALSDPYMSVEEYLEFERQSEQRHEYIDGYVYALAGGTLNHSLLCTNMTIELGVALRDTPCRVYSSDAKVRLSSSHYVYPDVSVSCDDRELGNDEALHYPKVVIEVLSPSTERDDRSKKFDYYRMCPTLQEYVLIDTERMAVDIFRRASTNLWTYHPFREQDQVVIACLKIEIPLSTLYRNIQL